MTYRDIVAVTGLPGLYVLLANKGDGAIVREISGGASRFLPARLHRVTPLETIEVYTTGANVRLHKIFEAMQGGEGKEQMPDAKSDSASLRSYFDAVYPDYDGSRVYDSDLKKMVRWYAILKGADLLKFEEEAPAETPPAEAPPAETSGEGIHGDTDVARGEEDGLANTDDMPLEGAAQLDEEAKADETTGEGLVEDATAGKTPSAQKAAAPADNGPHVLTTSTASAEGVEGAEPPAKKSRAKKAAGSDEGEDAAPKKTARKKKEEGNEEAGA